MNYLSSYYCYYWAYLETFFFSLRLSLNIYLDLVATAIAADMVQLVGENRTLVFFGLKQLRENPRLGFKIFINESRPLSSEYFFYHFIRNKSIKIKIIKNFKVNLFGEENKSHENYTLQPTKKAYIPLIDKIHLKYIKYKLRFLKKFNF